MNHSISAIKVFFAVLAIGVLATIVSVWLDGQEMLALVMLFVAVIMGFGFYVVVGGPDC